MFHTKLDRHSGIGKLLYTTRDVVNSFSELNVKETVVCLSSVSTLLFMDIIIKPRWRSRYGFNLPTNLVLVVGASSISFLMDLQARWEIAVVGQAGSRFHYPGHPIFDTEVIRGIFYDSLAQAVIIFTMSISMAMLMAKLHSYDLDSNRELVAYGACNLLSSFFRVQTSSASPAGTLVLNDVGAKTTFNGLSTAVMLLGSVTFLVPVFHFLPLATLAAMIIVTAVDILVQIRRVPRIWRLSRTDFVVWFFTWLSATFGNLEFGILVGVLFSAFGFIFNSQHVEGEIMVRSVKENLLVPGLGRAWTRHLAKTRVFYFPAQLFFANAESFKTQLYKRAYRLESPPPPYYCSVIEVKLVFQVLHPAALEPVTSAADPDSINRIILDCSAMTFMDIDGVNMLKVIILQYNQVGVQVALARCSRSLMHTLEQGNVFSILPRSLVFHEVVDALVMGISSSADSFLHRNSHI
ncbi:sulfate transporter [Plakobranchus ocellatus]|uniref:Sulfate transporter n=1 Tax=Plakobranchus ocellatus TaxID=259542 RepID=A0AAV4AEW5_9GAST|nr:sulfate transporter [Plakobranchus ocellatus]